MTSNTKDNVQYGTAVFAVVSGIALAYLSFCIYGDVKDSVLWYMSQVLIYSGGIFGVSIYFKTKLGTFESQAMQKLKDEILAHFGKDDDKKGGFNGRR